MLIAYGPTNILAMLDMYRAVANGYSINPRGEETLNIMNLAVVFDASQSVLTSFEERQLNLNYAKREWLWYLGADPMDDSIQEHATMWKKLKQPDGRYFSNYGQYMFGNGKDQQSQFAYVVNTLKADQNSRRASMVLLQREHLFADNVDTVCTYAINFTIVEKKLCMTVMMRSNDVIYGFTNDAFAFGQLYEFVYQVLLRSMPNLEYGTYTHFTNSMHVYSRHFSMIKKIVDQGKAGYTLIDVPKPTAEEVVDLVANKGDGDGPYATWLKTFD